MYTSNHRAGGRVVMEPAQTVGAGTKSNLKEEPPKESSNHIRSEYMYDLNIYPDDCIQPIVL